MFKYTFEPFEVSNIMLDVKHQNIYEHKLYIYKYLLFIFLYIY